MLDPNFGKKIQISNSDEYISLSEKYDYALGVSYETILSNVDAIAGSLGSRIGVNTNKLKLLLSIFGLGKIDGGKNLIDYINSRIENSSFKIKESDIAFHNLSKIFKNYNNDFNVEELKDIVNLFEQDRGSVYVEVIKTAYLLELSSQYLMATKQLPKEKCAFYKLNEIKTIYNKYKQTGVLGPNELNINIFNALSMSNLPISEEKAQELSKSISDYTSMQISKSQFVDNLNSYKIIEKKNKIR